MAARIGWTWSRSGRERSISFALALATVSVPFLAGCGGGSGSAQGGSKPLIVAAIAGFTPDAEHGGFPSSAIVQVLDSATLAPLPTASVVVNGATLTYDAGQREFGGVVSLAPGRPVSVVVSIGGASYSASTTQFQTYPILESPLAGQTWSGLRANAIRWGRAAPTAGATYVVGVLDTSGNLLWPGDRAQELPASVTSTEVPPGSLTSGERMAAVAIVSEQAFPGAATGSTLFLEGFGVAPFQVTVGTPVATAPGPSHLLVAAGTLVWSDGSEAPIKSVASSGGPTRALLHQSPLPESVHVFGQSLYWISGNQLLRSNLDGSGMAVLAAGQRDGPYAGTVDIVVDATSVYWVNTVSGSGCSPSCAWAIVRTPLDGSPSTTVASPLAWVTGLASDGASIYWEQRGTGPVSADGSSPYDSAIMAVPKGGGTVRTVVNGLRNGAYPSLPPGYIPGNWFGTGGIAVLGGDLFFADTDFAGNYRVLRVATSGGPLTVLQSSSGSDGTHAVQDLALDGSILFWIDKTSVNAVPVAGGPSVQHVTGIYEATSLSVGGGSVVWTENVCCSVRQNGLVRSIPVAGGPVTTLASFLDNPGPISVDGTGAYWVEAGPYGLIEGYGRIAHAPLSGGTTFTVVATIFGTRPPLASDGMNVFLADGWRVKEIPLGGGALDAVLVGSWSMIDVATDGASLFGLDTQGNVLSTPVGGGAGSVLAAGLGGPAGHLREAAGYLYWMDHGDTIRRVSVAGGSIQAVATGLPLLSDIAADATSVYYAEQQTGRVSMVPAGGGAATVLAAGLSSGPAALALDATTLYWIDAFRIGKVALGNGSATVLAIGLATDATIPNSIAVDAAGLYWTETGTGTIKRSDDK